MELDIEDFLLCSMYLQQILANNGIMAVEIRWTATMSLTRQLSLNQFLKQEAKVRDS